MCAKLDNIDQIRNVEWGRAYLWDIYFETPPTSSISKLAAFGKSLVTSLIGNVTTAIPTAGENETKTPTWFPIVQFNYLKAGVVNKPIAMTYRTSSIPGGNKERVMQITFIDDINHTMYEWISNWFNPFTTTDGGGKCLKFRSQMCRKVYITKLSPDMSDADTENPVEGYNIIPEGDVIFKGTSDDGLNMYTINFKIVNIIDMGGSIMDGVSSSAKLIAKTGKVLSKKAVGSLRYGVKGFGR